MFLFFSSFFKLSRKAASGSWPTMKLAESDEYIIFELLVVYERICFSQEYNIGTRNVLF